MNKFLFTSAVSLVLGTAALAQTPNTTTSSPATSNPPAPQSPPSGASSTATPSTAAPTTSAGNQNQAPPANTAAQSGTSNNTNSNSAQAPAAGNAPNQAQATPPSGTQTGTGNPAPATNQQQQAQSPAPGSNRTTQQSPNQATGSNTAAQQSPNQATGANTAAQPSPHQATGSNAAAQQPSTRTDTARPGSTNVNTAVNINEQQRTRISQSITRLDVKPLTSVNFSLSVGTAIPRDVRLTPLPADIVEIVPQYRGYNFVVVRDEIVIVDPANYQIVAVLPRSGRSTAAAPAPREQRKVTFSDRDREVIRKTARTRSSETRTTGSTARTEIRTGERVPDSVEIEEFPEEVYRESPSLREYRYIHRDSRTYIVEPQERRIIEEID